MLFKITAPFLSFRAHVINELLNGGSLMMADAVLLVWLIVAEVRSLLSTFRLQLQPLQTIIFTFVHVGVHAM